MGKSGTQIPGDLKRLSRRLAKHRRTKGKGSRLPDCIWRSAAELAREHSPSLVARVLSLDYYTLKEKAGLSAGVSAVPTFLELAPPGQPSNDDSCVTIELHSASGSRMTMRLPALDGRTAVEAVEAFWRSA